MRRFRLKRAAENENYKKKKSQKLRRANFSADVFCLFVVVFFWNPCFRLREGFCINHRCSFKCKSDFG